MSAARSFAFVLCFSICATAQTRTLAVYPGPADGLDSLSSYYLELELNRILAPAGMDVAWSISGNGGAKRLEAGPLIVGAFKGSCALDPLSSSAGLPPTRSLAHASVSNSRVLPYFTVDCARLIRTLAPRLRPLNVPLRASVLGRAMARVIAHEIYHILAQTADHDDSGLAKESLSLQELTAARFEFSPASLHRMTAAWPAAPAPQAGSPSTLALVRE